MLPGTRTARIEEDKMVEDKERLHILIVEDESVVAHDLKDILQSEGYGRISIAGSGEDALEMVRREPPDLILMDIKLYGKMDGIDAAKYIQEHYAIPVVYVTADIDADTRSRAMATVPFGFITKPFQKTDIHSAVELALMRKSAQVELARSENMFRTVIEGNADGIVIIDSSGIILFINSSAETMFGRPAGEMVGREFGFPVIEREYSEIDIVGTTGKITSVEMRVASTVYEKKDCFIASLRDITPRKKAEQEARRQRARVRSIFDYSLEGIVTLNLQGRVMDANQGFLDLFGYKIGEIRGKNINDIVIPAGMDQIKEARAIDQESLAGGVRDYERVRYRKDGGAVNVSISGGPVIIDGRTEGYFIIYRDITKQKDAERELVQNYKQILSTFEGTIQVLARAVELRDPYTAGHQIRVMSLASAIAGKMNLPEDIIMGIRFAASIHDAGKINIPAEILSKPSKLSATEFELIKDHPRMGYQLLKEIDFPWPYCRYRSSTP